MSKALELLFSKKMWNLRRPKLLISVTGGTHLLNNKPLFRDTFCKGLFKAATNTSNSIFCIESDNIILSNFERCLGYKWRYQHGLYENGWRGIQGQSFARLAFNLIGKHDGCLV